MSSLPENKPTDFLIIGAGIAGLATAIRLAKMSFTVRVVEQAPQLAEVGAGLSLWGAGQQALASLGLDTTLHQQAMAWDSYEMWIGGRRVVSRPTPALSLEDDIAPWIVTRTALHQTLLEAVPPGVEILLDAKVRGIHETAEGVTVELQEVPKIQSRNAARYVARYLIGADGQKSITRHGCGDTKPLRYAGYVCYRGLVENQIGLQAHQGIEIFGSKGRRVGVFSLPENKLYWFAFVNSKQQQVPMNEVLQPFQELHPVVEKLFATVNPSTVIENPIQDRTPFKASRQTPKNIALVGDAAHPNQPSLGMGASAALTDVVLLTDLIAQRPDDIEGAIARYYRQSAKAWRQAYRRHKQLGSLGQRYGVIGQYALAASVHLTTKATI
ncbi:MAG: FAD-dependent oxidoreductase [Alphaproteobacteria bacterium]